MKTSRIKLIQIYGERCFLNGIVLIKNPLTVHHMIPRRIKIDNRLSNLALLCHLEHQMFNVIENDNKRHAKELNEGFREYKLTMDNIIIMQMRMFVDRRINELGYEAEDKGKLLVLRRKK